jgi:hypothetical protein
LDGVWVFVIGWPPFLLDVPSAMIIRVLQVCSREMSYAQKLPETGVFGILILTHRLIDIPSRFRV